MPDNWGLFVVKGARQMLAIGPLTLDSALELINARLLGLCLLIRCRLYQRL